MALKGFFYLKMATEWSKQTHLCLWSNIPISENFLGGSLTLPFVFELCYFGDILITITGMLEVCHDSLQQLHY